MKDSGFPTTKTQPLIEWKKHLQMFAEVVCNACEINFILIFKFALFKKCHHLLFSVKYRIRIEDMSMGEQMSKIL